MVTLALTLPLASASDWTQFHCDVEHTGYSTSNAPVTNHTAWISDDIGADFPSSLTIAEGQVFVYCGDHLVSLDEYTGTVLWNVSVNATPKVCGSWVTPAYHDGRVFLSANETCCFDAADGSLIWTFEPPTGKGAVNGGCAIAEGMVFTSDWDGSHYYCLSESDGTEIWNFTVDGFAQSTPAVSVADDRVFFGSYYGVGGYDGIAYCVNMTTGDEIWNFTDNSICGSITIGDGVVYFTEFNFYGDGALYALYSKNGTVKWNKTVQRTDSTPALVDGRLYISGGYGGIQNKDTDLLTYCFDASTGDLIWNTSVADEIGDWKCSPAYADGMVFAGRPKPNSMDFEGTYALNASTGAIVWSYPEGGASPAVADGMVFTVGGGRVYAFGPTTIWRGDVALGSGTFNVTADNSGKEYTINRTCAFAALIRAAEKGGFAYTLNDSWYEDYGSLRPDSVAGKSEVGWDGWLYWVNYPDDPSPSCTADHFELNDGDVVTWYYGGMGSAPNNTDMLIRIETSYDYWGGDVALDSGTFNVTAESGVTYTINRTCALASIIGAARVGGFDYTINDSWYESYGTIYVAEIDGVSDWMYWVNYPDDPSPMVGANAYELADGDAVVWYHADSMESTPENTDMLVRIETSYDYWGGDVALGSGTFNVTADNSGKEYTINRTCAFAALIRAAEKGGFAYTLNDSWYEDYGSLRPDSVAGKSEVGWDGWLYWVNYPDDPSPSCTADHFELNDGDVVTWYYGGMGASPDNTDMLIRIGISIAKPGDVNHDGVITTADAVIALQMAVGTVPPNEEADVNSDSAVTSLDALMIQQAAAGAITV